MTSANGFSKVGPHVSWINLTWSYLTSSCCLCRAVPGSERVLAAWPKRHVFKWGCVRNSWVVVFSCSGQRYECSQFWEWGRNSNVLSSKTTQASKMSQWFEQMLHLVHVTWWFVSVVNFVNYCRTSILLCVVALHCGCVLYLTVNQLSLSRVVADSLNSLRLGITFADISQIESFWAFHKYLWSYSCCFY